MRYLIFLLINCVLAGVVDAQCHFTKIAELPFDLDNNVLTVKGAVDGHPTSILIETSSNLSALSSTAAKNFELNLIHSSIVATGAGGSVATSIATVREIDLDKYPIKRKMDVLVVPDSDIPFGLMIGADFLFNQDVELSFREKKIRLFRPTHCEDSQLGYWNSGVSQTPLLLTPNGEHRPYIKVVVNGQEMTAAIVTGAAVSTITIAAAARAGITRDSPGVTQSFNFAGSGANSGHAWLAKFDTFAIGDETIKNAQIPVSDVFDEVLHYYHSKPTWRTMDHPVDMILGMDFLKAHRVLFSESQGIFYFSYLGDPVFETSH